MLKRRYTLIFFALAGLVASNMRLVCSLSVAGEVLPDVYSAAAVRRGVTEALAAAAEIARGDTAAPEMSISPRVCFSSADGDSLTLAREVLDRTGGVSTLWRVEVDGEDAGLCSDPTALGEVLEGIVREGASEQAVSAELTADVRLTARYAPPEFAADLMSISARIRGMTEVMSVTGSGDIRLA